MADGTHIEWTDATWNIVNGCSVLSPGCTNCYAMRLAGTRMKHHPSRAGLTIDTKVGPVWNGQVRFNEKVLLDPLKWRRPRKIFVCAHGDLFHEKVPDEWIDRVFAVMALAPQHVFQVLTKRPERARRYLSADRIVSRWAGAEMSLGVASTAIESFRNAGAILHSGFPLPNAWIGTSVEDQDRADERIPILLDTPAAVRWLSGEPLLGPLYPQFINDSGTAAIDWIVVGGESGAGARPMHPDWARSLRDQCAAAGVPFLFKQWGEWAPRDAFGVQSDGPISDRFGHVPDWLRRYVVCADRADRLTAHSFTPHATNLVYQVGKKRAGRLLDGVQHDGYPA